MLNENLGDRGNPILEARKQRGLNQTALAREIGCHRSTVWRKERSCDVFKQTKHRKKSRAVLPEVPTERTKVATNCLRCGKVLLLYPSAIKRVNGRNFCCRQHAAIYHRHGPLTPEQSGSQLLKSTVAPFTPIEKSNEKLDLMAGIKKKLAAKEELRRKRLFTTSDVVQATGRHRCTVCRICTELLGPQPMGSKRVLTKAQFDLVVSEIQARQYAEINKRNQKAQNGK